MPNHVNHNPPPPRRRAKHSKYGQKPKTGVKVGGKKIGVKVQQFWGKGKKGGAKVHNPKSH